MEQNKSGQTGNPFSLLPMRLDISKPAPVQQDITGMETQKYQDTYVNNITGKHHNNKHTGLSLTNEPHTQADIHYQRHEIQTSDITINLLVSVITGNDQ